MFGIFTSAQKRARHDAQNWLHLANKIFHFRRDQLPVQEIEALQLAMHELRTRLKERADAAKLKMGMEKLEGCLQRSGGAYYPKSSIVDNVEFFLVAMILFLGIRAFIVQPFKIPTNSMWPTYNGLTAEVYVDPARAAAEVQDPGIGTIALHADSELPSGIGRTARWLAFGASHRRVVAPVDGEIFVPFIPGAGRAGQIPELVKTRKWLAIPDQAERYTLFVGNEPVTVTVPSDFRYDLLIRDTFFHAEGSFENAQREAGRVQRKGHIMITTADRFTGQRQAEPQREPVYLLATGIRVRAGENVLAFDVMTGDQLFVDRVSYHFVAPKVGDGFVFRTHRILGVERPGKYSDKYYIKRLVGTPGDTIRIEPPTLFRNDAPITGAKAFEKNAGREDGYPGYTNGPAESFYFMHPGETISVPEKKFFAMGDNSPDSMDSRYWGFIPEEDVVGRPIWIYFPFTRRWGPAR